MARNPRFHELVVAMREFVRKRVDVFDDGITWLVEHLNRQERPSRQSTACQTSVGGKPGTRL